MASKSVALVKSWITKNCPDLISILPSRAQFVVHVNEGSDLVTERVYLRSSFASWSATPFYEQVLAACTEIGRDKFSDVSNGQPQSLLSVGNRLVVGPANAASVLRANSAIAYSTAKERLVDTIIAKRSPGLTFSLPAFVGKTAAQMESTPLMLDVRRVLGLAGYKPSQIFIEQNTQGNNATMTTGQGAGMQAKLVDKHGTGKLFVGIRSWATSADTVPGVLYYMVMDRQDDSMGFYDVFTGYVDQGKDYLMQHASNLPLRNWVSSGANTGAAEPSWKSARDALRVKLGTSYIPEASVGYDSLGAVDFPWLPMVAVPRDQTYIVESKDTDVDVILEVEQDYDVVTVRHSVSTAIGAVPVPWYVEYATAEIAKGAANKAQLEKSIESLAESMDSVITYVELPSSIMLPVDLVEQTTLYRDYAKAREKACEDNDFMSKQFTDGMTFGALNTKINGSRNTKIFYGYRDLAQTDVLTVDLVPNKGVVMTLGGQVVTYVNSATSSSGQFAKADVEDFIAMATSGARVQGATVQAQLALWGYSAADYTLTAEGLSEMNDRIGTSSAYGTGAALYDFRWGSLGVSGFPLYNEVDPQTGYRIAMMSKGVLNTIGAEFRKVHLSKVLSASVRSEYSV